MLRLPPLEPSSPRPDAGSRNGRRTGPLGWLIRDLMKPMKLSRMWLRRLHMPTIVSIRMKRDLAMVRLKTPDNHLASMF
jgi:hypothetical protein